MTGIKGLMENKSFHWSDLAVCVGDDRFTGRFESLTVDDMFDMASMCYGCPVFTECSEWAETCQAVDVFANGYWRHDGSVIGED